MALLPTITQMRSPLFPGTNDSVIGLVSIPGMMTGAILGGASIPQAVKYQQIIMFLISATTTLAVTLSVTICMIVCIDNTHRLRPDRVTGDKAWMWRIRDDAARAVWHGMYTGYRKLTCRGHIEDETVENGEHQH
jgi:1,4-dihydroxy-2-naphthoate octaprenyltransferase